MFLDLLRRQSAGVTPAQLSAGSTVMTPGTFVPQAIPADAVASPPGSPTVPPIDPSKFAGSFS